MAGFALQGNFFLLRFFKGLVEGREPGMLTETECLSDILEPSADNFTLVQVKRTLSKQSLVSSLSEACLITQICIDNLPEALKYLRFQIAFNQKNTSLQPADIENAVVSNEKISQGTWHQMLNCFEEPPLLQIPDHNYQLYLLLWNQGLRNPKSLIERAQGRLLNAFHESHYDSTKFGYELLDLYNSEGRRIGQKNSLGYLLTYEDVAPDPKADTLTGILSGQNPTFEHLRKGYIKERPRVLDKLWAEFNNWLEPLIKLSTEIPNKAPVFWIAGRSGDGKSVLLLQLIAKILRQKIDIPLFKQKSGSSLITFLQSVPFEDEKWIFCLIDDIYDLHDREAWNSHIREQFNFHLSRVAMITCGPTEQKDQFSFEMSDCFDVHSFVVPNPTFAL